MNPKSITRKVILSIGIFVMLLCTVKANNISLDLKMVSILKEDSTKIVDVKHKTNPFKQSGNLVNDGDILLFYVSGISNYLQSNSANSNQISLMIEGIELNGLYPMRSSLAEDSIYFKFEHNQISDENMKLLYSLPGNEQKKVQTGLKIDANTTLYSRQTVVLCFSDLEYWSSLGWVLIIVFFVVFIVLIVRYPAVIKDSPLKNPDDSTKVPCYSFSKSQFAFWSFIVIASFIYIWAFTGDFNTINVTALVLLGITSATITTSNLISKNEETIAETDEQKKKSLSDFRLREKGKGHFFKDILSDGNGISVHRLQALVFNIVFGIIFIKAVLCDYTMPEFNETQLILLGLSNGTYAFLKASENK